MSEKEYKESKEYFKKLNDERKEYNKRLNHLKKYKITVTLTGKDIYKLFFSEDVDDITEVEEKIKCLIPKKLLTFGAN